MLALLGALTVLVLLAAILFDLLSPLVALIVVPVAAALLGGFGFGTSKFIITGIPRSRRWPGCSCSRSSTSASWKTLGCWIRS